MTGSTAEVAQRQSLADLDDLRAFLKRVEKDAREAARAVAQLLDLLQAVPDGVGPEFVSLVVKAVTGGRTSALSEVMGAHATH